MPIQSCQLNNKPGFKWGESGKCYTYTAGDESSKRRAKAKAEKQMRAIKKSQTSNSQETQNKNMKNKFQYIKNIAPDKSEATILLYKPIGKFQDEKTGEMVEGINGGCFAQEMLFLETQVNKINVRINSIGGSVLDGYSIISAIRDCKVTVCTYNDGLAASIAGIILVSGDERYARDYSITMIHNPAGVENKDVLDKIKVSLVTILKNSSILSTEDLDALMNEETYFNAEEAKEAGLIDTILSSGEKVEIENLEVNEMAEVFNKLLTDSEMKKNTKKVKEIKTEVKNSLLEEINAVKPGIQSPETLENKSEADEEEAESPEEEKKEMETGKEPQDVKPGGAEGDPDNDDKKDLSIVDKIKKHFGFDDDMGDEECYDALKEHKMTHDDLKDDYAKMQDKLEKLASEAKLAHRTKIDAMVNTLEAEGKIVPSQKEGLIKLALVDFDTVKNTFAAFPVGKAIIRTSNRISNVIDIAGVAPITKDLEWYWENDKPGIELTKVRNENPDLYNKLVTDYNEKQKLTSKK